MVAVEGKEGLQVIIMAGGEGSRLRPLTCDLPKPMVPVGNRPVMEYTVDLCRRYGLKDIGVTVMYRPEEIRRHFGDGSGFGVKMTYFEEKEPLGTAGSVKNAAGWVKSTFVVLSGDALTDFDFDLERAVRFHRERKALATLVLKTVPIPLEYGVVITDESGRIRRFLEKPGWGEVFSDRVNTGIYILEPEVLDYIPAGEAYDFSQHLFPHLLGMGKPLYGCVLDGYWCDIGSLEQYRQAQHDLLSGRVNLPLFGTEEKKGIRLGRGCVIHPTARIEGPVMVGDYTTVGANAYLGPGTVVGSRCFIGERASLKASVVWDGVYIGHRAELRGAVVCRGARIKDGAALYENSVVGEGSVVEEEARLQPGVKVWPGKYVERETVVRENLIWGNGTSQKIFGCHGVTGKVNVDVTPEFASRLASAFASTVGNGRIGVSSDMAGSSQMMQKSVIAGLLAAGAQVFDLGQIPAPVHRFAVRQHRLDGGIHLRREDGDGIRIYFTGPKGTTIDRNWERKVENLLRRDDFRRAGGGSIGRVVYVPRVMEEYLHHLVGAVDAAAVKRAGLRLVLCYDTENLGLIVPALARELGWELLGWQRNLDFSRRRPEEKILAELTEKVREEEAHLGAWLDSNGEEMVLVDERGEVISDEALEALMVLVIFRERKGARVVAPVTAPAVLEDIARRYGGEVVRTATAPARRMEAMLREDVAGTQGSLPQFFLHFDALAALVRLTHALALTGQSLSHLRGEIPPYYRVARKLPCSWEEKGKIIRSLAEGAVEGEIEMLDGVKIYWDDGWTLVLPDADGPYYHVYSEAGTMEAAEELAGDLIEKIEALRREKK